MNKLKSGNNGLDKILEGGFEENSLNLIIGLPGTGKTILAESIQFSNASPEKPALYISTVAEPLAKLIRFAQRFTFFKAEAVGEYVIYESVGDVLREKGFEAAIHRIVELIKEYEPAFLVIDSFKSFHNFATSDEDIARYQSELASVLASLAITSFWIGEYAEREMSDLPEFVIADTIIELVLQEFGVKDRRYLRVSKMRGSSYVAGKHTFDIDENGLDIFPRLVAPRRIQYEASSERYKTGIELLDDLTRGGIARGTMTGVFGPSGSGKTVTCLQTLFKGIEAGEKGLFASLGENPTQLSAIAAGFGWDIEKAVDEGMLTLLYFSADSVYIDEFSNTLLAAIDANQIQRVAIDSLSDLETIADTPGAFRDFAYALVQHLALRNVSTVTGYEVPDLFRVIKLSSRGVSHMTENVVMLNYARPDSKVEKMMTVLKSRGTGHDALSREFEITSAGITAA